MKSDVLTLRYGNTNTFLVRGEKGNLLIDTDYAGTLPAFYRALKDSGLRLSDISYVIATHYHPDHCGLIGELQRQGVKLILAESQKDAVHYPDYIFKRDRIEYVPADAETAELIPIERSREFLKRIGINGAIIPTASHSPDGIALILDDGNCFVGDLEPIEYIPAYGEDSPLKADWDLIMKHNPKMIRYAHAPARAFAEI